MIVARDIYDLGDDELVARLVNRGTDLDTARTLVSLRDRQDAESAILRQLNQVA